MASFFKLAVYIRAVDQFSKTFAKAKTEFTGFKGVVDRLSNAFGQISGMLTAMMGINFVGFMKEAAQTASDFNQEWARTSTLVEGGYQKLETYRDEVMKLSVQYKKSASDVARAMFMLESAQVDTMTQTNVLHDSLKLAQVGFITTENAATQLIKTMHGFRMPLEESAKVADKLFAIYDTGLFEMQELTNSIGTLSNSAYIAGQDLSDTGAALAVLTQTMSSPQKASITLTRLFEEMYTSEGRLKAQQAGLSSLIDESTGNFKSIIEVMRELHSISSTLEGEAAVEEFLSQFVDEKRAVRALAGLDSSWDDVEKTLNTVNSSQGRLNNTISDLNLTPTMEEQEKYILLQNQQIAMGNSWLEVQIAMKQILIDLMPVFKSLADVILSVAKPLADNVYLVYALGIAYVALRIASFISMFEHLSIVLKWVASAKALYQIATINAAIATDAESVSLLANTHSVFLNAIGWYAHPIMWIVGIIAGVVAFIWLLTAAMTGNLKLTVDWGAAWDTVSKAVTGEKIKKLATEGARAWFAAWEPVIKAFKDFWDWVTKIGSGEHLKNAGEFLTRKTHIDMPSFQEGGVMPHTGIAMLHAGETIIPPPNTSHGRQILNNIGGGGGGNYNITINITTRNISEKDIPYLAKRLGKETQREISKKIGFKKGDVI